MPSNFLSFIFLIFLLFTAFQLFIYFKYQDEIDLFFAQGYFLGNIEGDFKKINLLKDPFLKNQFCSFLSDGSLFCILDNKIFLSKDKKRFTFQGKLEGKKVLIEEIFSRGNFVYLLANDGSKKMIFLSKDGKSFQKKISFLERNVRSLFVSFKNPNHLLLAKDNLLLESLNQGISWRVKNSFLGKIKKIGELEDGIFIFLEKENGFEILKSPDFGFTFFEIFSSKEFLPQEISAKGGDFYLLFENGKFGILKGGNLKLLSPSIFDGETLSSFTLSPKDDKIIYLGGRKGIYISLDGGESWKRFPLALFEKNLAKVEDLKANPILPREFLVNLVSI